MWNTRLRARAFLIGCASMAFVHVKEEHVVRHSEDDINKAPRNSVVVHDHPDPHLHMHGHELRLSEMLIGSQPSETPDG